MQRYHDTTDYVDWKTAGHGTTTTTVVVLKLQDTNKTGPGLTSHLLMREFYTNFSITTPEILGFP